jgi:hypothetical protein
MIRITIINPVLNLIASKEGSESVVRAWKDENIASGIYGNEADLVISETNIDAELLQKSINAEKQKFLDSSDWKILRHLDQLSLNIATSMSQEEFQALLQQRQDARNAIVH